MQPVSLGHAKKFGAGSSARFSDFDHERQMGSACARVTAVSVAVDAVTETTDKDVGLERALSPRHGGRGGGVRGSTWNVNAAIGTSLAISQTFTTGRPMTRF
jgi:hypothetical protein